MDFYLTVKCCQLNYYHYAFVSGKHLLEVHTINFRIMKFEYKFFCVFELAVFIFQMVLSL